MSVENALCTVSQELPVETKLTRSEIIDLVIESVHEDLNKKKDELERALNSLRKVQLTPEIEKLVLSRTVVSIYVPYDGGQPTLSATVNDNDHFPLPKELKNHGGQVIKLKKEINEVEQALRQLQNKSAAKNTILKRFLEGTAEGRELLRRIGEFKMQLKTKMLTAKN